MPPSRRTHLVLVPLAALIAACAEPHIAIVAPPPAPAKPLQIATDPLTAALPEKIPFRCDGLLVEAAGHVYCVQPIELSWEDAERRCVANGGHLATIESQAEGFALKKALGSRFGVDEPVWIGLVEPSEGRWVWTDLAPAIFTNWASGEPNNLGDENCGQMYTSDATWNDAPCGDRRGFLCERRPLPPGQPDTRPPMKCPSAEISVIVDGHPYCLHVAQKLDWSQALAACKADGGELARVERRELAAGLREAFGPRAGAARLWIGLHDREREGVFHWTSGAPVEHTRWNPGEPNDAGDEDCTEWLTSNAAWNDARCDLGRFSLCEAPPR